jgi:hypothetical protein
MLTCRLSCHTASPCSELIDLKAAAKLDQQGNLALHYCLSGNLAKIKIPDPEPLGVLDGLWEHTCFEAFIAVEGEAHYQEFNFSPSGCYAAYRFSAYRQRAKSQPKASPDSIFLTKKRYCQLQASIPAGDLPENPSQKPFQLGLSAVVELQNGRKTYWALQHSSEQPDFHQRSSFSLSLNPHESLYADKMRD